MTRRLVALMFVICLSSVAVLAAKGADVQRDPGAVATLQTAIAKMGGLADGQVKTVQTGGSVIPTKDCGESSGSVVSTFEVTGTGFEFRSEFASQDSKSVFVSGHGNPASTTNDSKPKYWSSHIATANPPFHVPILVLNAVLTNLNYAIAQAEPAKIGNVLAVHVHVNNDSDAVLKEVTPQDWYFDPSTGLPLRVEFNAPDAMDALNKTPGARDFANYQDVDGLLVPFQVTESLDGQVCSITTINSVQFNVAVSESEFDL